MDSHILTAVPVLPCQVLPSHSLPSLAHMLYRADASSLETPELIWDAQQTRSSLLGDLRGCNWSLKATPGVQWSLTHIPSGPRGHVRSGCCCPLQSRARKGKWGTGQWHQPSHISTHLAQGGGGTDLKTLGICSSWVFFCILPGCSNPHSSAPAANR